jgi:hypothetical protein
MAIGGHWSVVAALCYQQTTAERGKAIANLFVPKIPSEQLMPRVGTRE